MLGSELTNGPRSAALPKTKRMDGGHAHKYGGPVADEWGPTINVERHIAYGSQEDRLARVQAKKREALLLANGHSTPDALGRYKRRVSIDRDTTIPSPDESPDALVYIHTVQPGDTMAGLSIKYDCPQAVLRKANRLWPNDSIQIRKVAYLPVDSCGIRGRKVPSPDTTDIDIAERSASSMSNGKQSEDSECTPTISESNPDWFVPATPKVRERPQHTTAFPGTATSPSQVTKSITDETPWVPHLWVQVDTFPAPIQIARLPRRALGFFPPTRRKSITNAYSDTTPPRSAATPPLLSTSSPRRDHTMLPSSPHRRNSKLNRHRSSSTASAAGATSYLATHLKGPGGVGTLDSTALHPGPAQDKLNQIFAPHLPSVAPRSSFESVGSIASSTGLGVGELGGKVEGWVRKMAQRTAMVAGGGQGSLGEGRGRGDLIELVEGWDMGSNNEDGAGEGGGGWGERREGSEGPRRGRRRGSRDANVNAEGEASVATGSGGKGRNGTPMGSTTRQDEERLLRERFPIGGRVFEDQQRRR